MIALFCVLIVFGLGHCDDLPSRIEVESSINRTVNEVERLIRQNPTLPRLARREIVDILFNITSKDIEAYQDKDAIEKARNIYQKALMIVLPYNAEDANENIKELYTKPPIVHIIADTTSSPENFEALRIGAASEQETQSEKQPVDNLVVTHASEKSPYTKTRHKNHRETYSEVSTKVPLKESMKLDAAPIKFTFNLDNLQRESTVTEGPTRRPVFRGSSSTKKNDDVFIVYSTSATTMRTTGASFKNDFKPKESRTTPRPSNHKQNVLSSDQWRYNAPPSTTQRTTSKPPNRFTESSRNKPFFLPTVRETAADVVPPTAMSKAENILKISRVTTHKTPTKNAERPTPSIYVTPVSSSSSSPGSSYNITYNSNSGGFRRITTTTSSTTTTTTTTTTMRPEVMELLASIGLRPENTTNVEEVFKKNQERLETKSQIPGSNGFIYTTTSGLAAGLPDSVPSIAAQNTFENPISEIGKGMNNLTPDVQLLFQRFGLQTSNPTVKITTSTSTPTPAVNTNSYTNFKPLPTSKIKDQDMREFLAMFGLGANDGRQRKAMPETTERPSLIEAVPSNMRQILENIGLVSRKVPKTTTPRPREMRPKETTKYHVFKPHEVRLKDEGQRMKINELLDTVKLVQEGRASVKDVRKVADDLLATTKTLKDGPDPLSLEEIIKIYKEDVKNEVKREQNADELVDATTIDERNLAGVPTTPAITTESVDVSSTTTTTMTAATPETSDSAKDGTDILDTSTSPPTDSSTSASKNLADLEESFGGTTRAPDPVLPAKRKNGLYFLVDWNSFLEVGEEDSEKVNLRFAPKVGDRSRFLPVTVP